MDKSQVSQLHNILMQGRKAKWRGWIISFDYANGFSATNDDGMTIDDYDALSNLIAKMEAATFDDDGIAWDFDLNKGIEQ